MREYNISTNLVRTIEQPYDKAKRAVQMSSSMGEWFITIVGVRQGCLLSPTLINIFLERIMSPIPTDYMHSKPLPKLVGSPASSPSPVPPHPLSVPPTPQNTYNSVVSVSDHFILIYNSKFCCDRKQ